MRNVFSDFFKMRIPLEKSFYIDKIGLDAGCGEGRYSWEMSNQGCEIISMDLSESVNTAYRNNIKNKKVHVIQGSIYSPPINKSSLDFVISHGVIHHLPDPKEGFNNLTPLVKEEGDMVIWVYGLEQMDLIYKL